MTGTRLPADIRDFEILQVVEGVSKNARKIFFLMLLGCAYAVLTLATTTDPLLLSNSSSSQLPILGTTVPIVLFYTAAPLILLVFFIYFHLSLRRLWRAFANLPARFQDGKSLDERAYPWLLNGVVRRHFSRLQERRPGDHAEEWVAISLAWGAVPLTVFAFWAMYLPRHEWIGSSVHIALLVGSIAAAIIFYREASQTLRGNERQPFQWRSFRSRKTYGVIALGVLLSIASFGAIEGLPWGLWGPWGANLRGEEVSLKPVNYWQIDADDQVASVKGANLRDRNLRYADAGGSFLVGANLQGADLRGADFQGADLRGADFQGADLRGADLEEADLRGVRNMNCERLTQATNWEKAYRDTEIECGKPIPEPADRVPSPDG